MGAYLGGPNSTCKVWYSLGKNDNGVRFCLPVLSFPSEFIEDYSAFTLPNPDPRFPHFHQPNFVVILISDSSVGNATRLILVTLAPFGGHFRERFAEKITFSLRFHSEFCLSRASLALKISILAAFS